MVATEILQKLNLGNWPTPLKEVPEMAGLLGDDKRLFIKRDDLAGIGLGGNKVRKLEYLLGYAKETGCDTVVTGGGILSNQTIAAAACAAKAGLACYVVMPENVKPFVRSFCELFGAHVFTVGTGKSSELPK